MKQTFTLVLSCAACLFWLMDRSSSAETSACPQSQWSEPRLLARDSSFGRVARLPTVTGDANRTYIIGHNFGGLPTDTLTGDSVIMRAGDGERLRLPPGPFTFGLPRAASDARGRVHLLWGEPAMEALVQGTAQSVWVATYDVSAGTWTPAHELYKGAISWGGKFTDEIASGDGHLVLSAKWIESVVFLFDGESWTALRSNDPDAGVTNSLAVHGGCLYNGYIRGAGADDPNSVFLRKSCDWGRTWSSQRIAVSGGQLAMDVRVRVGSDGVLHLIWSQLVGEERFVLHHVESRDSAATWSQPEEIALPKGHSIELAAAADKCAAIHILASHVVGRDAGAKPILLDIVWDGSWRSPVQLFNDFAVLDPAVWASTSGPVHLVVTLRPLTSPAFGADYRTYVSQTEP